MQANWSLILNVLLLIGVVISIGRLMKARRQNFNVVNSQPTLGKVEAKHFDDIISVRKVSPDFSAEQHIPDEPVIGAVATNTPAINVEIEKIAEENKSESVEKNESGQSLMMFLLAKENRTLAGYELLQTILAAGLRFGEGQLFHRHQHSNGQGPVLCSLASATATGVFDLQNIGAFSVRGLCLFMQSSGNPTIDAERLSIMLDTARQLSDDLGTHVLDEQQRPFNNESVARFCKLLNIKNTMAFAEQTELA